ncbi:hypothetical protein MMC10_011023 [Thelotrema lepadinum]|nr:hypothetical protein [Thelotrema lepadinum]
MSALAPRLTLLRHHLLAIRPNYRASLCRGFADLPPQPPKSRVDRFRARLHGYNARSPRFFQRWTTPLIDAPASHIFSFAILHEFTALVPLVGLAFLFHYTGWLPAPAEWKWAKFGVERGGKWLRKRGWINDEEVKGAKNELAAEEAQEGSRKGKWNRLLSKESRSKIWEKGEEGSKLVLE